MNMYKWIEMKKKIDEMPADDFLLLADLTKERLKKLKKKILSALQMRLILHCKS